ncbi:hypothetical protein T08_14946 [Trichinella sp. T8]|nr:hypothetical protein T08_5669 [Trichinella sp. T8]KRZ84578.1 hypothetical protein T08_14946 [Trichinella sp. T8]
MHVGSYPGQERPTKSMSGTWLTADGIWEEFPCTYPSCALTKIGNYADLGLSDLCYFRGNMTELSTDLRQLLYE